MLDRVTGKFLLGKPFVKVNWASGLDAERAADPDAAATRRPTWPGQQGGTNWYSPSYSPRTGLFYISAWEDVAACSPAQPAEYQAGRQLHGRQLSRDPAGARCRGRAEHPPRSDQHLDRRGRHTARSSPSIRDTGDRKWTFPMYDVTDAGILTTASDLLFTGGREGYFQALDARTGALLWKSNLGSAQICSAPITYQVDGKQYVTIICGNVLAAYALRESGVASPITSATRTPHTLAADPAAGFCSGRLQGRRPS